MIYEVPGHTQISELFQHQLNAASNLRIIQIRAPTMAQITSSNVGGFDCCEVPIVLIVDSQIPLSRRKLPKVVSALRDLSRRS